MEVSLSRSSLVSIPTQPDPSFFHRDTKDRRKQHGRTDNHHPLRLLPRPPQIHPMDHGQNKAQINLPPLIIHLRPPVRLQKGPQEHQRPALNDHGLVNQPQPT